jgi:hypothetical protein
MKPLKTINNGPTWATCVKMLPLTRRLAVSSFSRCAALCAAQSHIMTSLSVFINKSNDKIKVHGGTCIETKPACSYILN